MSQQINLFNPLFLRQQKYFSTQAMSQALGLILLGAGLIYAFAQYQVSTLSRQSEEAKKQFAAVQVQFAAFEKELSPQQTNEMLQEELQQLKAKIATNEDVLKALRSGGMVNSDGFSEYMRAFSRQTVNGLWLTSFEIAKEGTQISLAGAVTSPQLVPAYIRRLNNEKIMRGKSFGALQMNQVQTGGNKAPVKNYVEFTIQSAKAVAAVSGVQPATPARAKE